MSKTLRTLCTLCISLLWCCVYALPGDTPYFVKNFPLDASGSIDVTFMITDTISHHVIAYKNSSITTLEQSLAANDEDLYGSSESYGTTAYYASTAFDNESGTGVLTLPSVVTDDNGIEYTLVGIGTNAFNYCTALTGIVLPESVSIVGSSAFENCNKLASADIAQTNITVICESGFSNCQKLTAITLPATLQELGKSAFYYCRTLKSVDFSLVQNLSHIGRSAFNYCGFDGVVTFPDNVTETRFEATFMNCFSITGVNFPPSANTLKETFYNCSKLTTVNLEELVNLDTIHYNTFNNCALLTGTTIPSKVRYIGERAFMNCSQFTPSNLPDSLKFIGTYAFYQSGLTGHVVIPEGVTTIEAHAFQSCESMQQVTLPKSLKSSIAIEAFRDCSSLTKVHNLDSLPDITLISARAFYGCTSLQGDITLPENVWKVNEQAFYNDSLITSVRFRDKMQRLEKQAFFGCYKVHDVYFDYPGTDLWWYNPGTGGVYNSTTKRYEYQPTDFGGCASDVTIHVNRLIIEACASGNSNFKSNHFMDWYNFCPDKLVPIAEEVKPGTRINNITLTLTDNNGVQTGQLTTGAIITDASAEHRAAMLFRTNTTYNVDYDYEALLNGRNQYMDGIRSEECTNISGSGILQIPDSIDYQGVNYAITSIGCGTFRYLDKVLTGVHLPASIEDIGNSAFKEDSLLAVINDFNTLTSLRTIRDYAFQNCIIGGDLVFPEGMTYISGFGNFREDENNIPRITSVTLPSTLQHIGNTAFQASHITSVTIPDNCQVIGPSAFAVCDKLKEVNFSSAGNLHMIGADAFYGYETIGGVKCFNKVKHWVIPEGVDTIGNGAFHNCFSAESITLPRSLKYIGAESFKSCGDTLKTINLPADGNLVYVGNEAFAGSDLSLTDLHFPNTLQGLGSYVFKYSDTDGRATSNIRSIYIPNSVTSIGISPFSRLNCQRLEFEDGYRFHVMNSNANPYTTYYPTLDTVPSGMFTMTGRNGTGSVIRLPNSVLALANSSMGEVSADTIYIPASVELIDTSAVFSAKSKAVLFEPGSNLKRIARYAFHNAYYLDTLSLPEGLKIIEDEAFQNAGRFNLTHPLDIPQSVTEIGNHTFNGIPGVAQVTFHQQSPDSIVWRSVDWNDFGTPISTTLFVHRDIYYQCYYDVREDAFQFWFDFDRSDNSKALQLIPDPVQEVPVIVNETTEDNTINISEVVQAMEATEDYASISNDIYNDVLFTLSPAQGDQIISDEGCVQVVSTTNNANQIIPTYVPGTSEYADNFNGITIQVPAGTGCITVNASVSVDYILNVETANSNENPNEKVSVSNQQQGDISVNYECQEPTYVYIYGTDNDSDNNPQQAPKRTRQQLRDAPEKYARIYSITIGAPREITTAINNNKADNNKAIQKSIENGKVVIIMPDGSKYDAAGKQIK